MTKTAQDQFEMPALGQMQHWTRVLGHAQQLILERASQYMDQAAHMKPFEMPQAASPNVERIAEIQADMASKGLALWERFLAQSLILVRQFGLAPRGVERDEFEEDVVGCHVARAHAKVADQFGSGLNLCFCSLEFAEPPEVAAVIQVNSTSHVWRECEVICLCKLICEQRFCFIESTLK